MPTFSTLDTMPQDQKAVDPKFLDEGKMGWLYSLAGFKDTGQKNDWGKALGWINPVTALYGDAFTKHVENQQGAYSAKANTAAATGRDFGKLETVGGIAIGALGAASGDPKAIQEGIKVGTAGVGTLEANQGTPQGPAQTQYTQFKKGGNMKHEDVDMVDRATGKKVGEISYGERVISKIDNNKLKTLAHGSDAKAGKFIKEVVKKHDEGKTIQLRKGGEISKDKAAEILHDNSANGKKLTDKQRRFMAWKAYGKHEDGGEIMRYDEGGEVGLPTPQDEQQFVEGAGNMPINGNASGSTTPGGSGSDMSGTLSKFFGNMGGAGQIFSLAQALTGLHGANGDLPVYKAPQNWTDYVNKAGVMANQGFTPQELAQQNEANTTGYRAGLENVRSLSGGNNAFALGQSGSLASQYAAGGRQIGAEDAKLRRENFNHYGAVLGENNSIDRQIFEDKYNNDVRTKTAYAQLANTGLQQFIDRPDQQKFQNSVDGYYKSLEDNIKNNAMSKEDLKALYDRLGKLMAGNNSTVNNASQDPNGQNVFNPQSTYYTH